VSTIRLLFRRGEEFKNTVRFYEEEKLGEPFVVGVMTVQKWAARDVAQFIVDVTGVEADAALPVDGPGPGDADTAGVVGDAGAEADAGA